MNLFELIDNKVVFSPQLIALKPFRDIWIKDKTKNKNNALDSFYYIWYMTDMTSPYQIIRDEKKRHDEVIRDIGLDGFKITKDIKVAMSFYKKMSRSMISSLYESALESLDVVQSTFKDSKKIIAASPNKLKDMNTILVAMKQIPLVMKDLRNAESELIKEQKEKTNIDLNLFEESYSKLIDGI